MTCSINAVQHENGRNLSHVHNTIVILLEYNLPKTQTYYYQNVLRHSVYSIMASHSFNDKKTLSIHVLDNCFSKTISVNEK